MVNSVVVEEVWDRWYEHEWELLKAVTGLSYWNNLNEQCGPQTRGFEHWVQG